MTDRALEIPDQRGLPVAQPTIHHPFNDRVRAWRGVSESVQGDQPASATLRPPAHLARLLAGASEKIKVGIFVLLFLGVAGFGVAMFRAGAHSRRAGA